MKHSILALCIAFGAVNTADASQRSSLPLNADPMMIRLGEAVDRQVRRNFVSSIEDHAIKFGTLLKATPHTLANATLYKLEGSKEAAQSAVCFTNEFRATPKTICANKEHIALLFNEKALELDQLLQDIDTRISTPSLNPIIEQSMVRYTTIMNYVDEIKSTNEQSYQQIMKLMQ